MAKKQISKKSNKKNKQSLNYKFKENKKRTFLGLVLILIIAFAGVKILFLSSAATVSTFSGYPPVGIAASGNSNDGYWVAAKDGGVFSQGTAVFRGSAVGNINLGYNPVVGISPTSDHKGYYLVSNRGEVYAFGNAVYAGGVGANLVPGATVVGIAAHNGGGYWIIDNQGHTYAYGGAPSFGYNPSGYGGSIVSIAPSATGNGYFAISSYGQVYGLGDAGGCGNPGGVTNVVAISADNDGSGCFITTSNGAVYAYNAQYQGGMNGIALNGPIVGITSTSDGKGYWMVASDGGVFTFGNAQFQGAITVPPPTAAPTPAPAPAPAPKPGTTTPTAPASGSGAPTSTGVTQAQCDALKGLYSGGKCACVYGSGPNGFGICTPNDVLNYDANHGIVGDPNQPVAVTGPLSCPAHASASSTGCNCNLGYSSGYGGACDSLYLIDTSGHGCMNGFSYKKPWGTSQGYCDSGNLSPAVEKILAKATGVEIVQVGNSGNSYTYTCLARFLCKN